HIVFGELAPKSVAIRKAVPTTLMVAFPLRIFYFIFKPFIKLLNGFANLVLRAIGVDPIQEQDIHTEEEIKMIITESEEGGAIEETERTLIQNVFDFDDRRLKDVYTHRKDVVAIDINASFEKIVHTVVKEGYSRYPVYEESEDDLKGILSMKDILPYILEKKETDIRALLRPVVYVPEGLKIKDLLRKFQKDHVQMAIVTDEYGEISGLVTMEDILEELVGDIQDEHDAEQPIVEAQNDNTFIVNAHENLDDVNKLLPVALPGSEEYSTISGLITYQNETVPEVGELLRIGNYEVTILSLYRSSVEKVKMRLLIEKEESEKEEG
ncbi:MAG: hemolysin family protein, partial [Chitinophagaceae bacterium]|nr:hemolysin family protein [Chitinophagaceae bacterium]